MPSTRYISKPRVWHVGVGVLALLLVFITAFALVLPAAQAYAAGSGSTSLGIMIINSEKGQSATPGTTKLGIRITNSTETFKTEYTLTFDLNGAPGTNPTKTVTYNQMLQDVTPPSWTGYTFQGYYDSSEGGNQIYDKDGKSTLVWKTAADDTLYAHWSANAYTVTLNPMDGTGGTASTTATFDAPLEKITRPQKTGYTFQGYFDEKSGGTKYYNADGTSAVEKWDKAAATTLYAQWQINAYTVTFDTHGGTNTTQKVNYNSPATRPTPDPERDGYTFAGWYTAASGGSEWNFSTKITDNTTIHARWTAKPYTIDYELAGGSVSKPNPTTYTIETASFTLTNPTKDGYTFAGWTGTGLSGAQINVTVSKGSKDDRSYTATWTANKYQITFDKDGGNGGSDKVDATFDAAMPHITKPSKDGYTFQGYYGSDGTTQYYKADGSSDKKWDKTENATLKAHWKANNYTVTFEKDGGTGGDDSQLVTFGSAMPSIKAPKKTGYEFQGYFDDPINGTQYYTSGGTSANTWDKATDNVPLYAHWTAKKYTVSFDSNNGTGGQTAAVEATYDAPMPTISSTPPLRTGYRFAGWYDEKEGGNLYYDAEGVSKANWDKATNTTLYAHWTLQITFKFPTSALIEVDASGNVSGPNLEFESTTPEDIKVTAVKSTRSESAASLFADDATLKGVRILLKPTTGGADSEVKVPLTVNETSSPANWTIAAANPKLAVAFSLSLPSGAQLNYLANDGQVSIANLSYEVSAAKASS